MSNIVGLTDTTKILTRSSLSAEASGMQVLLQSIVVTKNGASLFTPKYLDPHPDFPTMSVETISTNFMEGGLAEISIQYVGLLAKGSEKYVSLPSEQIPTQPIMQQNFKPDFFPKAYYSLSHNPGQSLYFPFIVQLKFIDVQSQRRINTLSALFSPAQRTRIPTKWRGLQIPGSTRFPFTDYTFNRNLVYYGVICRAVDFRKRGFFCEVTATFSESYIINGTFI